MSQLSHAQFPLRRHPNLLVDHRRSRSAAVAEPRGANGEAVTGSGGRLHFGMVAGIKSERWPTSNRNPRPDCLGIRSRSPFTPRVLAAAATGLPIPRGVATSAAADRPPLARRLASVPPPLASQQAPALRSRSEPSRPAARPAPARSRALAATLEPLHEAPRSLSLRRRGAAPCHPLHALHEPPR